MTKAESDIINRGDYVALVLLVTVGLIGTALFMAWLLEHRGIVAPGSSPFPRPAEDDVETGFDADAA